jgi:hypothetical protein
MLNGCCYKTNEIIPQILICKFSTMGRLKYWEIDLKYSRKLLTARFILTFLTSLNLQLNNKTYSFQLFSPDNDELAVFIDWANEISINFISSGVK